MEEHKPDSEKKRRLLRRVRRQRLKYVTILPSLITMMNGICGFMAISFAGRGIDEYKWHQLDFSSCFAVAGYLIFVAMIADMLDGRVARMSHTTSSFGGQLDSLCDMISFGVAPAFLVLKVLEYHLPKPDPADGMLLGFVVRFIWLSGGVYMVCAAIRLARFNVENEEDETAHMSFSGLPTPAAAGVVASLVIFHEDMLFSVTNPSTLLTGISNALIYMLPFIAIGSGILMISRIRYPHVVNKYLKGKKPITHLTWFLGIIALIWLFGLQSALVISFCLFALTGFVRWLYYKVIVNRFSGPQNEEPPMLSLSDSDEESEPEKA